MTHKALFSKLGALALASTMAAMSFAPMAYLYEDGMALNQDIYNQTNQLPPSQLPPQGNNNVNSSCELYINNSHVSQKPYYDGSILMLPLRAIVEKAGWDYSYHNGTATFGTRSKSMSVTSGKNSYPNGKRNEVLEVSPTIVDNTMYVPWRFIDQCLNFPVSISRNGRIDVRAKYYKPDVSDTVTENPVYVNKTRVGYGYYSGQTLMVPLRAVVKQLGYRYGYSNSGRYSVFSAKNINSYVSWDENKYPIDNEYRSLERAPEMVDGSVYVPISFMTKALKCKASVSSSGKIHLSR